MDNIITVNNQYEFYKNVRFDEEGKLLVSITNLTDRVVNEFSQTYFSGVALDVIPEDDGLIISITSETDYSIVLPPLDTLPIGFHVTLKNTHKDNVKGVVVPYGTETIENLQELPFYGKGFLKLAKMVIRETEEELWMVSNYSSLEDTRSQGKPKRYEFSNESSFNYVHNLGYIPMVQVWLEDGQGGYSDVSVDIDHNFTNMNEFYINLDSNVTGFILYV